MGPQQRRAATRTVLLGLVGLAIVSVIGYVAGTAHSGLPFRTTTAVRAAFHDVGSVHVDSQVRQNSVPVGRVSSIDYRDGQAVVGLELDGERPVFSDASAKVWDFSALGQKFIEFSPGTPAAGPLGNRTIGAPRNNDSADIYQALNVFDPKTLGAATGATREVGGGIAGHGDDLQSFTGAAPGMLGSLGTVSASLSADDANLPGLLHSADRLASRFVGRQRQIADTLGQTDATLRAVTTGGSGPLRDTLRALPATLDDARTGFDSINGPLSDTRAFLRDVRPGAAALAQAEPQLRGVLREAPAPLGKVPPVADDAKPALEGLATAMQDAQPLAPRLAELFTNLAEPVSALAPYARDTESLWARLRNNLAENADGKHYGRTTFNVNGRTLSGLLPGGIGTNPYPKPSTADLDRFGGPAVPTPGGNR